MKSVKAARFVFPKTNLLCVNSRRFLRSDIGVKCGATARCALPSSGTGSDILPLPSAFPLRGNDQEGRVSDVIENFKHGALAYRERSSIHLLRALLVLRLSSVDFFVDYSEQVLKWTKRLFGKQLYDVLLKETFFGQFCAGETVAEVRGTVTSLRKAGIRSMICVPIETAHEAKKDAAERAELYNRNMLTVQECINTTAELEKNGFAQLKITALCSAELLHAMNPSIQAYDENRHEDSEWDVKKMAYAVESGCLQDIKLGSLDEGLNCEFQALLQRLFSLAKRCKEKDLRLMVDAEQTYIQNSLNYLVLVLQRIFNQNAPVVYNTYQCYRKDTLSRVKEDSLLAEKLNFIIAGKLVRGAYMDEERKIARENGYPDPINDSFEATTAMYHSVVDFLFPLISSGKAGVMIASHNEETVSYVVSKMQEFDILSENPNLCFAQLLGMCDHVTYSLGKYGYQVFKSTPYGSIDETLLYLCRRARENRSVISRCNFEKKLVKLELNHRAMSIVS